jgi:hypothetical protein
MAFPQLFRRARLLLRGQATHGKSSLLHTGPSDMIESVEQLGKDLEQRSTEELISTKDERAAREVLSAAPIS